MKKPILPILFLTLVLDMIGIGMLIPILPSLLIDSSSPSFILQGYSESSRYFISGLLTALFGLTLFIFAPILGELSDVYGRKKLLLTGVIVLAVAQTFFGFGVLVASLPLLLISRLIAGLAGANFSIAQAAISDVSLPHERAKNFGLIGAAFGIGFILGPILGGTIASVSGSGAVPFFVAGALGLINATILFTFLPETRTAAPAEKRKFTITRGVRNIAAALRDKQASPLYISSFLYQSGFTFFTTFIGILLATRFSFTEAMVGIFFGVVGVWVVITQTLILGRLTKKYNERKIIRFSMLLLATGILLYAFIPNPILLYLCIPLISIGNGLTIANLGALISKSVSADKQGAALGLNGSVSALATGTAPLFAGVFGGVLALKAPFILGAFLVLMAWVIVTRKTKTV